MMRVHFLRRNTRTTACGRRAKKTRSDTRQRGRVTCLTCKRVLRVWKEACQEIAGT